MKTFSPIYVKLSEQTKSIAVGKKETVNETVSKQKNKLISFNTEYMSEMNFDFERFQKEAIQGLYEGKSLTGENGIFAPLLKHFLESALEGELSAHLLEEKAKDAPFKNRRNGKATKQIKSLSGEFDLQTPRDRSATFDSQVEGKRQVIIIEGLEEKRTLSMASFSNLLKAKSVMCQR